MKGSPVTVSSFAVIGAEKVHEFDWQRWDLPLGSDWLFLTATGVFIQMEIVALGGGEGAQSFSHIICLIP